MPLHVDSSLSPIGLFNSAVFISLSERNDYPEAINFSIPNAASLTSGQ